MTPRRSRAPLPRPEPPPSRSLRSSGSHADLFTAPRPQDIHRMPAASPWHADPLPTRGPTRNVPGPRPCPFRNIAQPADPTSTRPSRPAGEPASRPLLMTHGRHHPESRHLDPHRARPAFRPAPTSTSQRARPTPRSILDMPIPSAFRHHPIDQVEGPVGFRFVDNTIACQRDTSGIEPSVHLAGNPQHPRLSSYRNFSSKSEARIHT